MLDARAPQTETSVLLNIVLRWSFTTALLGTSCASAAISFFPSPDYAKYPARDSDEVDVLMGAENPRCQYVEVGTIDYDPAMDGVPTGSKRAMKGVRREAGKRGASGIYKVEYVRGVMGEMGVKAMAYRCLR